MGNRIILSHSNSWIFFLCCNRRESDLSLFSFSYFSLDREGGEIIGGRKEGGRGRRERRIFGSRLYRKENTWEKGECPKGRKEGGFLLRFLHTCAPSKVPSISSFPPKYFGGQSAKKELCHVGKERRKRPHKQKPLKWGPHTFGYFGYFPLSYHRGKAENTHHICSNQERADWQWPRICGKWEYTRNFPTTQNTGSGKRKTPKMGAREKKRDTRRINSNSGHSIFSFSPFSLATLGVKVKKSRPITLPPFCARAHESSQRTHSNLKHPHSNQHAGSPRSPSLLKVRITCLIFGGAHGVCACRVFPLFSPFSPAFFRHEYIKLLVVRGGGGERGK